MKNVIKEIGIAIMLLVAIALILSIIFYEYIPNNKTVPIGVKAYTLPEEIETELNETFNQEEQNVVVKRFISDSDLDVYESKKDYNKGKANPFADYSKDEDNTKEGTNNKTSTNTSTSNNNSTGNTSESKTENTTRNEVYVSTPGKN